MYVCVCLYVGMYVCMHAFMYVCVYICMYLCLYVCMYVCVYILQVLLVISVCYLDNNNQPLSSGAGGPRTLPVRAGRNLFHQSSLSQIGSPQFNNSCMFIITTTYTLNLTQMFNHLSSHSQSVLYIMFPGLLLGTICSHSQDRARTWKHQCRIMRKAFGCQTSARLFML